MSDTPRTDKLVEGISARYNHRKFYVPEDVNDSVALCAKLERELAEARETLKESRDVLGHYWFGSYGDGDEYNNDDVIEISEKIDIILSKQGK